ncbi:hypothetical protein MP638_003169 [Amoeboaphelidium occidentale]|nr:hypothetical protein MP638_003169 [Amoeboaphelidium occidentale]
MQAGVDPMLGFRDLELDDDAKGVKPCKCGGFDHKRVSHYSCPLYQGKIRDRYKLGDHEATECSIKLGLANFLHPALSANQQKQLNASIQDAVHRITDVYAEASRFLNGFVLWALESGHSIPDLRYSDGIMAQVFQAIQQKETKAPYSRKKVASSLLNLYADTVYAQFRPKQVAWCDGSYLSYSIKALSKQYAVNCMVHVQTNIKRFLKQVVKFRLEQKLNGHISIKSFNLLLEYLMRQLSRYDSQYNVVRFPLEIFPLDGSWNIDFSSPLYETIVTAVSDVWSEALLILENKNITKKYVNKEWLKYIRPMHELLRVACDNYQKEADARRHTRKKGRSLRLYSLVPLAAYQQTHIPLDSCAFHQILVSSGLAKDFGCNKLDDFLLDPRKYWAMVFNLGSVETINRRFAFRVVTNGVEIGINMLKPKIESNFNEWGLDEDNNYHPINITAETRVVALDPGRRHLYDAVGGTYLQQENFSCSNSRWREISGTKYGTQMRRQWMSQNKDLQKKLHNTPTPKCSTLADYGKYLGFFLSERDNILGFFREPKWRRLRFITHRKRQKAYDILAKELTGGDPNCVIAYGAGKFECSSRGHAPTPNRKLFTELRKRCRTRLVSEFKTSQICANCNHRLDKVYRKTTKMKPGKTESNIKHMEQTKKNSKKLCWGLKKCNNHLASVRGRSYCLTLWDRDINAALNIRHVFLYRNANKNESPGIFKRKKKSDDDETKKDDQNSTQPQAASPVAPIDMARGS